MATLSSAMGALGSPAYCTDAAGNRHGRVTSPARIVSLVPSLTELLCSLGLGDQIVGRTGFCIHPREAVRTIPKLGGTKDVDIEGVIAARPTHLIVNIDENRREVVDELAPHVDAVYVSHPLEPADNLRLFEDFGFMFDRESEAEALAVAFRQEINYLSARTDLRGSRVLYLIWRAPWMTVSPDTYISRMLALINWKTYPTASEPRYPEVSLEDYAGTVDKVLLSSEPYPFRDKHIAEVQALFGETATVQLVDGEMLSWYGSRVVPGLRYLQSLADAA